MYNQQTLSVILRITHFCLLSIITVTAIAVPGSPTPTQSLEVTSHAETVPAPTETSPMLKETARPPKILRIEMQANWRYTMAIPADYSEEQPTPLVLALHYAGHGTPYYSEFMLTGLVEPALRELRAIIVAPDCPGRDWMDPRSEKFVLTLLDSLAEAYNVDAERTLIAGFSMGGIGTWHLGLKHQDRFSAALVMAGYPPFDLDEETWETPIYIIHAREDEVIPLTLAEAAVEKLQTQEIPHEFIILDGVTHYETPRFYTPLKRTVKWIEEVWQDQ